MKTSQSKLKSSLILLSLCSFSAWAKPVGLVTEVKGQAFIVNTNGATEILKSKAQLEEKTEIMVEEGGSVTVNDYYDATYHLTGGTHLKFFDKSVQLKKGKAWIQSQNSRHPLSLTTANGNADFWKSEFIATFEQGTSRSQFLVVNGEVEVSNVLARDIKYNVTAGTFSIVDPEVDNGTPRAPTKVGMTSLNEALAEFKQLPSKMKETTPAPAARGIASVEEEKSPVKKGEIIYFTNGELMNRLPASVTQKMEKKKIVVLKSVKTIQPSELTAAPIKFYGTSWKEPAVAAAKEVIKEEKIIERTPASFTPAAAPSVPQAKLNNLKIDQEFGDSLKKQQGEQPQYSNELKSLIDDLKSY